jgi:hypothetical protein
MELWVGEVVATRMMNGVYVYMFVYSDLLTGAQLTVTGVHESECTCVIPFLNPEYFSRYFRIYVVENNFRFNYNV